MQTIKQIFFISLKSTSRNLRWWIFGFCQILSFSIISSLSRFNVLFSLRLIWLIGFMLILQPVTVTLWLEIKAKTQLEVLEISYKGFFDKLLVSFYLTVSTVLALILLRTVWPFWVFLTLASSLILATSCMAALYAVLHNQNIERSVLLSLATWGNKISLAVIVTLILLVGHAASFAFVHAFGLNLVVPLLGLAGLTASATIILFLLAAVGLAFLAAFINCFFVLLFLHFAKPIKHAQFETAAKLVESSL